MEQHRFSLPPSSKKYTCPQCETPKEFKRYIDREREIEFPDFVGRCERQGNCAYHYTPKQFFADNPDYKPGKKEPFTYFTPARPIPSRLTKPTPAPSLMNADIVARSLNLHGRNNLVRYLCQLLGKPVANELVTLYQIGTSNHWSKQGATVFWQRDEQGNVRAGKIMLYDPATGKRRKEDTYKPTWVHSVLRLPDFTISQCLFGLHQLPARPDDVVAIVESEKTALIATAHDKRFIWLATGGLSNLSVERCRVLAGRKVVLYPDLSVDGTVFKKWNDKARELATIPGIQINVSRYLEDRATDEQKVQGLDLADFLLPALADVEPITTAETAECKNQPIPTVSTLAQQLARPGSILKPDESQIERLTVDPCDVYPAEWDLPNVPDAKPCISAKSFHEWQQQHPYYSKMGLASLNQ